MDEDQHGFKLGDIVLDSLTGTTHRIIGREQGEGFCGGQGRRQYAGVVVGYWLDNDLVGGGRFPWEIDKLPEQEES